MAGAVTTGAISEEILRRTAEPRNSICPSEVARGLSPEGWRPLMGAIRAEAARLSAAGQVEILRKGKPVAPELMHGVIRLRKPSGGKPGGGKPGGGEIA
jgi:hypothetical protein